MCFFCFVFNSLLNLHRDLPVLFVSSLDYWGTFCAGGLPTSIFFAGAGIRTHSMAISTSSAAALMTSATTPPNVTLCDHLYVCDGGGGGVSGCVNVCMCVCVCVSRSASGSGAYL